MANYFFSGCAKSRFPSRGFDQVAVLSKESPRSRTGFTRKRRDRKGCYHFESLFPSIAQPHLYTGVTKSLIPSSLNKLDLYANREIGGRYVIIFIS